MTLGALNSYNHLMTFLINIFSFPKKSGTFTPSIIWRSRLKHCIQPAISRLVDSNGSEERALIRLQEFIDQCDLNGKLR